MGKNKTPVTDLSARLEQSGFTKPQLKILFEVIEDEIIEAAKLGLGVQFENLFIIMQSSKALNPKLTISAKQRFSQRFKYHVKKKYESVPKQEPQR